MSNRRGMMEITRIIEFQTVRQIPKWTFIAVAMIKLYGARSRQTQTRMWAVPHRISRRRSEFKFAN